MTATISFTKPCDECGGTGIDGSTYVSATHLTPSEAEPCYACYRGWLPDDETVEAAKRAFGEAFIKALGWGESKPFAALEVYAIAQVAAEAALVAAARYQSEGKP